MQKNGQRDAKAFVVVSCDLFALHAFPSKLIWEKDRGQEEEDGDDEKGYQWQKRKALAVVDNRKDKGSQRQWLEEKEDELKQ